MEESKILTGSRTQIPLCNSHERALLEEAVRNQVPILSRVESVRFWESGDWVYIFVISKGLWRKLRIFGLQRLYRFKDPNTGIDIVEDPNLDVSMIALMVSNEKGDFDTVERIFKEGVQSGIFNNLEVTLPPHKKINQMLYEQRLKHYDELRRMMCGEIGTDAVVINKIFTRGYLKIYQLRLTAIILDKKYDIRIIENNQKYKLEIKPNPEGKFGSIFQSFPLTDDIDTLLTRLKTLKVNGEATRVIESGFVQKYGLVPGETEKEQQDYIAVGAWQNKLKSYKMELFSDDCLQNVWVHYNYKFHKSVVESTSTELTEINMNRKYTPNSFIAETDVLLTRFRLLDESDAVNPLILLDKLKAFKISVRVNKQLIWDHKQHYWELFSLYILDFPIPLSIMINYDFVADRIDIKSLFLHGEFKNMSQLAQSVDKVLSSLKTTWTEFQRPKQISRCSRFEFPKLSAEDLIKQVIPQLTKYDVLFANRHERYDAALYLGASNILSLLPSGNYKLFEASEHLRTSKLLEFITNTEFIVFREAEPLESEEIKAIEDRLLTQLKTKFIYYGFANNSDEIIFRIRWNFVKSLETTFLLVMIRQLMERNLMEKELVEYIGGLVSAKTDEARRKFIIENKHSIGKSIKRIKQACSPQMTVLLNRFDWLFEAQIQ